MMLLILLGLWVLTLPVSSWVLYTALMHMDKLHADGLLDPMAEAWARRVLYVGWVFDFCLNTTWGTVYFRSWPRELTLTGRLNRLVASGTSDQKVKALRLRAVWLNNFDRRGIHT